MQAALASLIAAYVRLVHRTTRWRLVNLDALVANAQASRPGIVC